MACQQPLPIAKPFSKLSRKAKRKLSHSAPLEHALRAAGIVPYDTAIVEAYKAKKLDAWKHPAPLPTESCESIESLVWLGLSLMLSAFMSWVAGALFSSLHLSHPEYLWVIALAGLVSLCLGVRGRTTVRLVPQMEHLQAEWRTADIHAYPLLIADTIPSEVKDIGKEISMRCPAAEIEVHYLYHDPFLCARHVDKLTGKVEEFFVAFWDENGFIPSTI